MSEDSISASEVFPLIYGPYFKFNERSLEDIPQYFFEIPEIKNCKYFDFSQNLLKEFPTGIEKLNRKAILLNFSQNFITRVPYTLKNFDILQDLNLSHNRLNQLPSNFFKIFKYLKVLDLSHNHFQVIPDSIYKIEKIEALILNNNRIEEINCSSNGLNSLKKLKYLYLQNNSILEIPVVLREMKEIRILNLSGNKFCSPPTFIVTKGAQAIMEYLQKPARKEVIAFKNSDDTEDNDDDDDSLKMFQQISSD